MKNEKDQDIVKYLYIGQRILNNKLVHAFIDKNETVYFKGVVSVYIGFAYYGGKGKISRRPKRVSDEIMIDEVTLANYEAEDMSAKQYRKEIIERERSEKEIKALSKSKKIKQLKKDLELATKDMSPFTRRRFLDYLAGF